MQAYLARWRWYAYLAAFAATALVGFLVGYVLGSL